MSAWTLHHIVAACQVCEWSREHHGPESSGNEVLAAARHHAKSAGHYVQVERGQHAHYGMSS